MSKGKRRGSPIYRIKDPEMHKALGILKRLQRRLLAGQRVPFLVATIEPMNVPGSAEPIANPVVASRGMNDPRCKHLVKTMIAHLQDLGVMRARDPKDAPDGDGLEIDI